MVYKFNRIDVFYLMIPCKLADGFCYCRQRKTIPSVERASHSWGVVYVIKGKQVDGRNKYRMKE